MLSSQTGMRSCRFVKCHPCAHWVTHLLCVDFRASEALLDHSMASSIKTELAIEWKVDVVIKIFDACSSMHAKALAEEQRVHNGQPGNCGHVEVKHFQFDVPSALTHVWSSKQLV